MSSKPEKSRRSERPADGAANTRDKILISAKRVFGEKGYAHTTVADVIAGAGIARGTFYLYFQDKDVLFEELFRQVSIEMHHALNAPEKGSYRERVRASVSTYFAFFQREQGVFRCFFETASSKPELTRYFNDVRALSLYRIERHIARNIETGRCNPVEPRITAYSLGGLLEWLAYQQAVVKFHPWGEPFELERLVEQVTDMWCRTVYRAGAEEIDPDREPRGGASSPGANR
ncbi:TetR/AcrR family transcriptional regulator [Quisquiliibacterium transsilvanicum]|uniref:AcrR family transcriptional regulator n=1 Tax=Quisquiliibacterium transsilvanicum TaxID=1549638 RepID=A0A7W8HFN9_9BURK|nr:TetR/AcrR family transcriptional regulator [Quisquiliibacterium transsilvanicum]MBB5271247.1 AcrR family transcriptional regulator [Quisquiliibacterium transsilvanicum]